MKANPTVIGSFIVGAVALIVAAVMVFGSGTLFTETASFVLYFSGSVNGLNVGAPVKFRGVEIGQVTDVRALYNPQDFSAYIQVGIEVKPSQFNAATDGVIVPASSMTPATVDDLIEQGFRGQLQMQSFVTGLLFVDLDFYPGTPVTLVNLAGGDQELPTIPTALEQVAETARLAMEKLSDLPLEQLLLDVSSLLQRVNAILHSPEAERILPALTSLLQGFDEGMGDLRLRVPKLLDQIGEAANAATDTLKSVNGTLTDARQLIRHADGRLEPLLDNVQGTLTAARRALGQAQKTLKVFEDGAPPVLGQAEKALAAGAELMGSDSVVVNDLAHSLEALEEAARSIRVLADYLQRNPEALIRGKGRTGGR